MYTYPDPKTKDKKDLRIQRFYEMLPAVLTIGTFILLIILSLLVPFWVAIFILIYNLYWLFKSVYLSIHLIYAYSELKKDLKINWLDKIKNNEKFDYWYHAVMLLTYDESKEILEDSINAIKNSNYPLDKMIVVIATEEREGDFRLEKEKYLLKRFKGVFKDFIVTNHPDGIEGEMKAKGANATFGAKILRDKIKSLDIKEDQVIISVFDSDTIVSPNYFAGLTYKVMQEDNPYKASYQPLPMYHNNIWEAPAFARVVAISSSFWHMMESVRFDRMVTFSSHSMMFKTLIKVNYWPVNMVSDDSVIYWKCVDFYNGDYKVVPIHLSVSLDAVQDKNPLVAFSNQYKQLRRWAYGIENLATTMRSYAINKKAPFFQKWRRIFNMIIGHYTWATSAIILAFYVWAPIIFGGKEFKDSVLSNNLPIYVSTIMNITLTGVIITTYINIVLLPPKPKKYSFIRNIMMYLQWALIPIVALFLGSLPAIEAQIRLFLGKYLGFWVTPKIRNKD